VRFSFGKGVAAGLGVAALIASASLGSRLVAEPGHPVQAAPALINGAWVADPVIAADPLLLLDDNVTYSEGQGPKAAAKIASSELDCMAKVVRHEAANQSRQGQRAVAEILVNRAKSGRFPSTICGVANQPGQFFDTTSYNPSRDTAEWKTAMEISREVLSGQGQNVARGAYFYHAAYQAPTRFFRGRQQVLAMGDHIFYR